EVNQKGAVVLVDGKEVGRAPLEDDVFVEPGSHAIEARLAEFTDAKETVEGAKGGVQTVRLTMSKVAPVAAASGSASGGPAASAVPTVRPPKAALSGFAKKAILITGGVLGAGGLAAGIGLTVAANSKGAKEDVLGAKVGGPSACF